MNEGVKVSQQALTECRAATVLGAVPKTIDESALDALQELLRSSFEDVLDKPGGDQKWQGDRPKMLFQSGLVGGLATLQASLTYPPEPTVSQDELFRAFYFVKSDVVHDLLCQGPAHKDHRRGFLDAVAERLRLTLFKMGGSRVYGV